MPLNKSKGNCITVRKCKKCEHNYKHVKTKSKIWKETGNVYTWNRKLVCDEIERFYLYCTKCGNIIKK